MADDQYIETILARGHLWMALQQMAPVTPWFNLTLTHQPILRGDPGWPSLSSSYSDRVRRIIR